MKNIVIAGAGKGIGLKTVELLKDTNQLFTIARNNTAELSALSTKFYQLDLVTDNLDALNDLPETIDGLVYCPGSINLKPFNRLTTQDFLNDFNQNVLGAVSLVQKLLPNLKRAGGASIVLFSTVAAKLGMPFHASVAATVLNNTMLAPPALFKFGNNFCTRLTAPITFWLKSFKKSRAVNLLNGFKLIEPGQ